MVMNLERIKEYTKKWYISSLVMIGYIFIIYSIFTLFGIISGFLWYIMILLQMIILVLIVFIYFWLDKKNRIVLNPNKIKKVIKYLLVISSAFIITTPYIPLIYLSITYNPNQMEIELKDEVERIVETIDGDTNKTLALLKWFDRSEIEPENFANCYHRYGQSDCIILTNLANNYFIYSKYPYFCARQNEDFEDWVLWIFHSRCGKCGEYGELFSAMANLSDLVVRKVQTEGEDHVWNEVLIDNEWITVDATAVNYFEGNTGFNLDKSFMETKVGNDYKRIDELEDRANVSYVYATYPDKPDFKEDITKNYTHIINITVFTIDSDDNPIDNVSVSIISHNRLDYRKDGRNTGLKNITNITGQYTFSIGGGHYTFKASKENLYGEIRRQSFNENKTQYEVKIVIK